ncbi:MAG: hypothetical protein EA384_11675 [Spirochaetaceae bacterium]|nr:MAG: hypothetical protein EA384_11675 [Spirochaetaceae bacterium]
MKRTALFGLVLLAVVTLAAGAQARGGMTGPRSAAQIDEVELTGRLVLAENELPVLVSGGVEYTLRIPPALSTELQVSSGQQAAISGYLVERASFDLLTTQRQVMVRSMEVGGTRYVLPADARGGRHMMGDRRDWRGRAPQRAPAVPDSPRAPRSRR